MTAGGSQGLSTRVGDEHPLEKHHPFGWCFLFPVGIGKLEIMPFMGAVARNVLTITRMCGILQTEPSMAEGTGREYASFDGSTGSDYPDRHREEVEKGRSA